MLDPNPQSHAAPRSGLQRAAAAGTALALALAGVLLTAVPAAAAQFTVMNNNDSGAGSLRDAITSANTTPGPDVINFDPSVTGTITLLSDLPEILESVSIDGPGSAALVINGSTHYVFWTTLSPTVDIDGITITDAGYDDSVFGINFNGGVLNATDIVVAGSYGGILIAGGSGTVTNSGFFNNDSAGIFLNLSTGSTTLTNVKANGNAGYGIDAEVHGDATLTMSGVEANGNVWNGLELGVTDAAGVTATDLATNANGLFLGVDGINADFEDDSTGVFTGLDAHGNGGSGLYIDVDN